MEPNTNYTGYNSYSTTNGNSRRKLILIVAGAAVTLLLITLLINLFGRTPTGTLTLTAPKKTQDNAAVSVEIQGEDFDPQVVSLKPGETKDVKVNVGNVRVDGAAGDIKAVDVVTVRKGENTKLTTPNGEQRGVKQQASDAQYCPVLGGDTMYSYNCDGDGGIVKHTPLAFGATENTFLFEGLVFGESHAYKDGVMAYESVADDQQRLMYVDLTTQSKQAVPLGSAVKNSYKDEQPIIVTAPEYGDGRFAMLFQKSNTIYVFKDVTDTNPVKINPSKDAKMSDKGRVNGGSFSSDRFLQYAGASAEYEDGHNEGTLNDSEAEEDTPALPYNLVEYDATGKAVRTTELPDDLTANGMAKLTGDFYVAEGESAFTFYHWNSETRAMDAVYDMEDVADWTIWNNNAYVQAGNVLYEFKPGKDGVFGLHSLYASDKYRVSGVYNSPKGILFTAFAGTASNAPLNVYQLLDTPALEIEDEATVNPAEIPRIEPVYVNFEEFIDQGMVADQMELLKFAVNKFVATRPKQIEQIGVSTLDYTRPPIGSNDNTTKVAFTMNLDGSNYRANITYLNYSYMELQVSEPTGKQIFDSGRITSIN